jgi:hypothetical protein
VLAAAMLLVVAYYVATRGVFQGKTSGDGWFGFMYLRSIFFEHTLDMQRVMPEYLRYFGTSGPWKAMPNRCPIGPVFVWAPFYLVSVGITKLLTLAHFIAAQHEAAIQAWFCGLGTLGGVLVGWRFLYVLVERRLGRAAARIGTIAAVWATPIVWYAVTQPGYQHGLAFGLIAILVERWDAKLGDASPRRFALLGLVGGAAMMMRPQELLYLLLPAGEIAWRMARGPDRGRWLVGGVVLGAATLVAFSPQLAVWYYYTGGFHPVQAEPIRWTTPFFVVTLFSTRAGLLAWSPITYASVTGLFVRSPARRLAVALGAVFAIEIYIVAAAWVVSGGYSFGARRLSDAAVVLAVGLAMLYARASARGRRVVVGFTALCIVMNVAAMELQRAGLEPSSGGQARPASLWLRDAHAPEFVQRLFARIGYPFSQPAGWLFAIEHDTSASAFEGIVGNFMLERDGQWMTILTKTLPMNKANTLYVPSGLAFGPGDKDLATVIGPIRMLLPMFARERVVVDVIGAIPAGDARASWNGQAAKVARIPAGVRLDLPPEIVHAGVNELRLELPERSRLQQLDFNGPSTWWR